MMKLNIYIAAVVLALLAGIALYMQSNREMDLVKAQKYRNGAYVLMVVALLIAVYKYMGGKHMKGTMCGLSHDL